MNIQRFTLSAFIAFLCSIASVTLAWADNEPIVQHDAQTTKSSSSPFQAIPGLGSKLLESRLDAMRGGDVHVNQQDLNAKMSETSASNLTTGSNTISEGSFANANGLPIVIQNSGNGVIIQNSTILNLNVK